jgi:superfamily I DNA/RNA helicase
MRVLLRQRPTPEQISIVRRIQQGVSLIRGAAGSGKTSTALMALRAVTGAAVNQLRNDGRLPADVLVLTYYNSVRGYVATVAREELADYSDDVRLYVATFDKWAFTTLGWTGSLPIKAIENQISYLSQSFPRDIAFVVDEVHYVLGRFRADALDDYLAAQRTGRGASPQMDRGMRQRLLDEVIRPLLKWKAASGYKDFHDLAASMAEAEPEAFYDVIVVDEAQDLSANQLRAVLRHAAADATITIITDSAQRIYPRGAPWAEAGLMVPSNRSFRLTRNYRNTREIAALAASIARGISIDDDGSLPDPSVCERSGDKPVFLKGLFNRQLAYALARLASIDLKNETVGFLHLKGGGWFGDVRTALRQAGYDYCELQGVNEWPEGDANIGLCTLHSAKGLEFDHVFMIGLAQAHTSYGSAADDDRYESLRRLLAMGVGRARKTVCLGTKPSEALAVLDVIDPALVEEVFV